MPKHPSVTKSDTDGRYYLTTELEWLVEPNDVDPGILGPKKGAIPRNRETGLPE